MKYFNLKREMTLYLVISLIFTALGLLVDRKASVFTFALGCILLFIRYLYGKRDLHAIRELSDRIDGLLHGEDTIEFSGMKEGELGVLYSEIHKMTIRLREQTEALSEDKIRLSHAISDISHQLRTPLTSMNLAVSLLSKEDLSYDKRIVYSRQLKKQLERISWLVEALLKISKIDAGTVIFERKPQMVKDIITRAVEPFVIPMELREIDFVLKADQESFLGDASWCVEAFGNLIKNCLEHTAEGGRITVTATETALYTEIIVEDNGEGFVKEDIPYLFERFYKGQNAGQTSIGIGLSLTRMILSAQEATILAKNVPDGGASFVVRFYKQVI